MKNTKKITLGILSAVALQFSYAITADTIITNGKVYTLNSKQPTAEAVAIQGDKIVAVGKVKEVISKYRGKTTKVIDAKGGSVFPGFQDTHMHIIGWQYDDYVVPIYKDNGTGYSSKQELLVALKEGIKANKNPDGVWFMSSLSGDAAEMTADDLDTISTEIPVVVVSDGHMAILNHKAMNLRGVTKDTIAPPGGMIVKDPKTGEPVGRFKEFSALQMLLTVLKPRIPEFKEKKFADNLAIVNSNGITRLHSAGLDTIPDSLVFGQESHFSSIDVLGKMAKEGKLTVRFSVSEMASPEKVNSKWLDLLKQYRTKYHDGWVDVRAIKLLADGVTEQRTAGQLTPYRDESTNFGIAPWGGQKMVDAMMIGANNGFDIWVHAVGDRTVRDTVNGVEAVKKKMPNTGSIFRIEHGELIEPSDYSRIAKLNIGVTVSPVFLEINQEYANELGKEREALYYPTKQLIDAGVTVAFSSDYSVSRIVPLAMIQASMTMNKFGRHLTLPQAIEALTINGAKLAGRDKYEGSIQVGKLADIVILDKDLFKVKPQEIENTVKVTTTMVDGKVVYQKNN